MQAFGELSPTQQQVLHNLFQTYDRYLEVMGSHIARIGGLPGAKKRSLDQAHGALVGAGEAFVWQAMADLVANMPSVSAWLSDLQKLMPRAERRHWQDLNKIINDECLANVTADIDQLAVSDPEPSNDVPG